MISVPRRGEAGSATLVEGVLELFREFQVEVYRWALRIVRARVVPTLFLLVIITIVVSLRYYFEVPNQFEIPLAGRPLERAIIFPMAVVPNLCGAWRGSTWLGF